MKVLKGHLTANNKQVIKYMLANNMEMAKSGRTTYAIQKTNAGTYKATIISNERHCIGANLKPTAHYHEFIP